LLLRAEGLRGGVRRRRERVVVWDFRRVVVVLRVVRGSAMAFSEEGAAFCEDEEDDLDGGVFKEV
jgi:hypothetical protein